jgi:hypothetical protein
MKVLRCLFASGLIALGIVVPAAAWELNDSQEPGSVLVFPKFIQGSVVTPDQGTLPATEFEISVTCPVGATCSDFQPVILKLHYVCPGCRENDFRRTTTVNGTLRILVNQPPIPPCPEGYLIAWVVNNLDQPIKFDGLIGDAVLRESPTAVAAYNALPIQAVSTVANGAVTGGPSGELVFDGVTAYREVPGVVFGTVKFNVPGMVGNAIDTSLTLLTLDTLSNRPNAPVFVDLNFYNQFENPESTFTSFTCWEQVSLTNIDPNLTQVGMGSVKGSFASDAATKFPGGPVTLLGIVLTRENDPTTGALLREYAYWLYNDSQGVPTTFFPF